MIRLKIDNIVIETTEGSTLLEVSRKAGISIPSMCFLNGYENHPSCMVCIVRDNKTGTLIPSCAMMAADGMEISTCDPVVLKARKEALELLLSDHVGDCEAPCSLACPAGMNIPLMNRLIGEGRFTEALKVVKEEIALPYILGYICPAPCEKACRRKTIDEAVSICLLKRFTAYAGKDEKALEISKKDNDNAHQGRKKVAVIGSGPAGLAAAYYLLSFGHSCDIYDKEREIGGTLRKVIPEKVLPGRIIDIEVGIIRSMGAGFRLDTLITKDNFKEVIANKYDAVILATGDVHIEHHLSELVEMTNSGYKTNDKNMSSSVPGIFVCGSAIRPHKMAVRSVAQGKEAALSAHHYLKSENFEKAPKVFNSRFDKLLPVEYDEYLKEASRSGRVHLGEENEDGYLTDEAIREALRCLHCDCRKQDSCKLRAYADEYQVERKHYIIGDRRTMTKQFQHDLVVYEPEKCIKCGLCIEICKKEGEIFGLAFEGRGFDVEVKTSLGTELSEALTHTAVRCVQACPTGALALKNKYSSFYQKNRTE